MLQEWLEEIDAMEKQAADQRELSRLLRENYTGAQLLKMAMPGITMDASVPPEAAPQVPPAPMPGAPPADGMAPPPQAAQPADPVTQAKEMAGPAIEARVQQLLSQGVDASVAGIQAGSEASDSVIQNASKSQISAMKASQQTGPAAPMAPAMGGMGGAPPSPPGGAGAPPAGPASPMPSMPKMASFEEKFAWADRAGRELAHMEKNAALERPVHPNTYKKQKDTAIKGYGLSSDKRKQLLQAHYEGRGKDKRRALYAGLTGGAVGGAAGGSGATMRALRSTGRIGHSLSKGLKGGLAGAALIGGGEALLSERNRRIAKQQAGQPSAVEAGLYKTRTRRRRNKEIKQLGKFRAALHGKKVQRTPFVKIEKSAGWKSKAMFGGGAAATGVAGTLGAQRGLRELREAKIEKTLNTAPGELGSFYSSNPARREEVATFLSKMPRKKPVGVRGSINVARVSDPQLDQIDEYRKMKKTAGSTGFQKLAGVLCGYDGPCSSSDGELWCEKFQDTPLFEQAKALELQDAQLDMERAQSQAERDQQEEYDHGYYKQREALRQQRTVLEAQLKMHQLQGGMEQQDLEGMQGQMPEQMQGQMPEQQAPEAPPAPEAPSAPEAAPASDGGQVKTAAANFLAQLLR